MSKGSLIPSTALDLEGTVNCVLSPGVCYCQSPFEDSQNHTSRYPKAPASRKAFRNCLATVFFQMPLGVRGVRPHQLGLLGGLSLLMVTPG